MSTAVRKAGFCGAGVSPATKECRRNVCRPPSQPRRRHHDENRRGLAPLELVLALPILLFLMALMVNAGAATSWKVRALGVARNSLWANRSPTPGADFGPAADFRSTADFPSPTFWPPGSVPDPVLQPPNGDLGGPSIATYPLGPTSVVNPSVDILDPALGVSGVSDSLTRRFPLLTRVGPYTLNAHAELLQDTWAFTWMDLAANHSFRIPLVYAPQTNSQQQETAANAYSAARQTIIQMLTGSTDLWPLDQDQDIITYGAMIRQVDPNWNIKQDFVEVPYLGCTLDSGSVNGEVAKLINKIQGSENPHVQQYSANDDRADRRGDRRRQTTRIPRPLRKGPSGQSGLGAGTPAIHQ